jgi:hypothetical protein
MFSNCSTMPAYAEQGWRCTEWSFRGAHGRRFILITGIDGTRYAVRQQAVAVIHP